MRGLETTKREREGDIFIIQLIFINGYLFFFFFFFSSLSSTSSTLFSPCEAQHQKVRQVLFLLCISRKGPWEYFLDIERESRRSNSSSQCLTWLSSSNIYTKTSIQCMQKRFTHQVYIYSFQQIAI